MNLFLHVTFTADVLRSSIRERNQSLSAIVSIATGNSAFQSYKAAGHQFESATCAVCNRAATLHNH